MDVLRLKNLLKGKLMTKCPKCDCCEGKEYLDKRSGKVKINLCNNCRFGLNGHKKMAKPKPINL